MYILIGMDVDGPYFHRIIYIYKRTHIHSSDSSFQSWDARNIYVVDDEKLQLNDLQHTLTKVTHTYAHAEIVTFV